MTTPDPSPAEVAPEDTTEPDTADTTPDTEPPAAREPEPPDEPEPDTEPAGPDREAARYRRALRATEAERDTLRTQLHEMQRGQVETMIGNRLYSPADFWKYGPELDQLLSEDGRVDPAKVDEARAEIVRSAPYLAPSVAAPSSLVTATGVPTVEQSRPVDPRNPFRRARGLPEIEDSEAQSES